MFLEAARSSLIPPISRSRLVGPPRPRRGHHAEGVPERRLRPAQGPAPDQLRLLAQPVQDGEAARADDGGEGNNRAQGEEDRLLTKFGTLEFCWRLISE